MATKEIVGSHSDGDYLHGIEVENARRAENGCGVLTHSIELTVTEGNLVITVPPFDYWAPDGSGGRKFVSYAGDDITAAAADNDSPANDALVGDADGNVTLRAGTPTAEAGDVADAPMVTLADDEVLFAKVRREAGSQVIRAGDIKPRAIDVSEEGPRKGSDIASASALNLPESGTYFDVTGTTGITSIESRPAGFELTLQFDGVLTLTHHATDLILLGGTDYTTTAGDVLRFVSEGSGDWREVSRTRAVPAIAGPYIPSADFAGAAGTTQAFSVNTTARVTRIRLDRPKLVSTLSVEATAAGTPGTVAFAIFSEDGQTRHINGATASISGSGIVTTDITDVWLPAGVYYVMAVSQSTANVTLRAFTAAASVAVAAPSGTREISGTVTVTAGTIPTTFNPDTDVTYASVGGPLVRLD